METLDKLHLSTYRALLNYAREGHDIAELQSISFVAGRLYNKSNSATQIGRAQDILEALEQRVYKDEPELSQHVEIMWLVL